MLTDSQRKTYQFIHQYIQKHGYSPKLPEIAKGIGIRSIGVIHRYLQALIEEGLIAITPHKHRGIQLIAQKQPHHLALVGKIAAGKPIEAISLPQELNLSALFAGENRYALRVQGDSMIEEGILDGDIVICRHSNTAEDGAVVVALIDNAEATLKRIKHHSNGMVTLIPANSQLKPIVYEASRVQVQGVLMGVVRVANK